MTKDRLNFEHLPMDSPQGNLLELPNSAFIPSLDDIYTLRDDIVHVSLTIINKVGKNNFASKLCYKTTSSVYRLNCLYLDSHQSTTAMSLINRV